TIPASSLEELNTITKQVESTLASLLIVAKRTTLQMEDGFRSTLPLGRDKLFIVRNMDTTSLASTFPFTSSELSSDNGIMYGINEHNGSLIVFDRFSLENANTVILSKSGGGKSYLTKLEASRSLMFDTEVIVIDPEDEYRALCQAVGGEYIPFKYNSPLKVNPLDLSGMLSEDENELSFKIQTLHRLMRVMLGALSPTEDAILDRALVAAYQQKGITLDPKTQRNMPPLLEDVYKVLVGMEEPDARGLAERLERYVKGSLAGFFSSHTTVNIQSQFTVFSVREVEDELRPIAMFLILDFIWTRVRKSLKRRILIVDEAWYMMRYPDSAMFLWSIAKRARKYYLGLTTITQDIEDFLASDLGHAIIQNSSIQILLKQSPSSIEKLAKTFALSEGEKHLLLAADVGEGLFFAGPNHAAIRIVASPEEHRLITSKPQELLEMQEQNAIMNNNGNQPGNSPSVS
ncbi:MAG: ATP-binding protein, partial [bacterium]|nr:ATP-binding protein [bacterium]